MLSQSERSLLTNNISHSNIIYTVSQIAISYSFLNTTRLWYIFVNMTELHCVISTCSITGTYKGIKCNTITTTLYNSLNDQIS